MTRRLPAIGGRDGWEAVFFVLLLALVVLMGVVVVAGGDASTTRGSTPLDPPPSVARSPILPGPATGPAAAPARVPDPALPGSSSSLGTPSSALSIPLGDPDARPVAYELRLAYRSGEWQISSLDSTGASGPTNTLTLALVLPWRELDRAYTRLNLVLR